MTPDQTFPGARRRLFIGVALVTVLVAVAGCGRRGALEAPPGVTATPKPAASERIIAPVAEVTTSDRADLDATPGLYAPEPRMGENKPVEIAPAPVDPSKPKKRFLLDPLVN